MSWYEDRKRALSQARAGGGFKSTPVNVGGRNVEPFKATIRQKRAAKLLGIDVSHFKGFNGEPAYHEVGKAIEERSGKGSFNGSFVMIENQRIDVPDTRSKSFKEGDELIDQCAKALDEARASIAMGQPRVPVLSNAARHCASLLGNAPALADVIEQVAADTKQVEVQKSEKDQIAEAMAARKPKWHL